MLANRMLMAAASSAEPVDITFVAASNLTNTANQTTYSFTDVPFGSADAGRYLIAHIVGAGSNGPVSSVSIGGQAASLVTDGTNTAAAVGAVNGNIFNEFWIAAVPTGTTGTVSITWTAGQSRCAIAVFRMTGNSSVQASQVATDGTTGVSASLTIPANGGGIGGAYVNAAGIRTFTWTNLTEQYDQSDGEGNTSFSGALSLTAGAATRTATPSSSITDGTLVLAAWA